MNGNGLLSWSEFTGWCVSVGVAGGNGSDGARGGGGGDDGGGGDGGGGGGGAADQAGHLAGGASLMVGARSAASCAPDREARAVMVVRGGCSCGRRQESTHRLRVVDAAVAKTARVGCA